MPRALVTGAATGIGAAIALRLAADGFDLVVHHNRSDPTDLVDRIRTLGRQVEVLQADLAQAPALDIQGPLDAFVANAGQYTRGSFADTGATDLALNLDATARLTQALLPNLAAEARIVFVGSIAAERGSAHGAGYAAAKAGLVGLGRSLARELAPRSVNVVSPGYIDTVMIDESAERRAQRETEVPLGRVGHPDEVAAAVAWLCGPGAAYTTGTVLRVNGGLR